MTVCFSHILYALAKASAAIGGKRPIPEYTGLALAAVTSASAAAAAALSRTAIVGIPPDTGKS